MTAYSEELKSLHTTLVDSRKGYEEALEDAKGKGLTPLFLEMIDMRKKQAAELAQLLIALGEQPNDGGSFMASVHRTIIGIRALFSELDERILPGLIDGEERIADQYYQTLITAAEASKEHAVLMSQRAALEEKIRQMKVRAAKSEIV